MGMKLLSIAVFVGVTVWHLREGRGWAFALVAALATTLMWFGLSWVL